jgi:hypothetical protein
MSTRYIEIDSTYRDRTLWPLPSRFDIIFSQSGRRSATDAIDPVSLAIPIKAWTSNRFNALGGGIITVTADLLTTPLGTSSDLTTFIVTAPAGQLQQAENYYKNAVIYTAVAGSQSRITNYEYLGNNRAQITIDNSLGALLTNGINLNIADPTDLTSTTNPYIFVPSGRLYSEAYSGMYIYNETRNDGRLIKDYDEITHLLTTETAIPGTWTTTDNYSIRRDIPNTSSNIVASTTTTVTLAAGSSITNFYKDMFVRIRATTYGNGIILPETEARRIVAYNGTTLTLTVSPPFSSPPVVGDIAEIDAFSYDNFNPLNYSGSIVSQQDLVCYEIELISLIIPNQILKSEFGGRAVYYPYVYVELTNITSANSGNTNIIYSNNPNSSKMLFRVPIIDTQQIDNTLFLKLNGGGCIQTIKFKPNDNLRFSVRLNNGQLFETVVPEYYSPQAPNALIQISAMFSIKRV